MAARVLEPAVTFAGKHRIPGAGRRREGRAEATLARAEAKASANRTIQATLTPEVLEYLALLKWDGKLLQSTNGSVPFLDLAVRR